MSEHTVRPATSRDNDPVMAWMEPMEPRLLMSAKHIGQIVALAEGVVDQTPADLVLTEAPAGVSEAEAFTLAGTFTGPSDLAHTVRVDWGDSRTDTLVLDPGVYDFSFAGLFADDQPTATGADDMTVTVTVSNSAGQASLATHILVSNVAPTVTGLSLAVGAVDENGTAELSGTFADPGTLDTHTITVNWGDGSPVAMIDLPAGQRGFAASHQYLDDDPTGTAGDLYTVTVTVADDDGGTGSDAIGLVVNNVSPDITGLSLAVATIDENGTAELSGAFADPGTRDTHTVAIDWGDGSPVTTLDLALGKRDFAASHQYLDDAPTGTPSDVYTISVSVTDDDTGTDSGGIDVTVNNVPPVIASFGTSAPGAGDAAVGQDVTVAAAFTDVGTLDTHTAVIDWGDGTATDGAVVQGSGSGTVAASHAYAEAGIYTVTLTVTDDDSGQASAVAYAIVSGVAMHDGVVYVIGTDGPDAAMINQVGRKSLRVHSSLLTGRKFRDFELPAVQKIVFLGADGNDKLSLAGNVNILVVADGGAGDDMINVGLGGAIVLGAEGNDKLQGGRGRDILIGGAGKDMLVGGPGDDLLIGGSTAFDVDDDHLTASFDATLLALLAEWTAGGSQARGHLTGEISGGLNGQAFLSDQTVFDDGVLDKLVGSSGNNWLWEGDAARGKPGDNGSKGAPPATPPAGNSNGNGSGMSGSGGSGMGGSGMSNDLPPDMGNGLGNGMGKGPAVTPPGQAKGPRK